MGDESLLADMVDFWAGARPDGSALTFVDGPEWCWRELRENVRDHAEGLQRLGVRRGDFVLSWMPNGPVAVLNLLALGLLGAVYVPVNTSYRGTLLAHVLRNSGARLMIAHGGLVERLAAIDRAALETVVVIGPERPALGAIRLLAEDTLKGRGDDLAAPDGPVSPWDTAMVIYTSGTTGPSKGVLSSHRHMIAGARGFSNVGPGDRNLTLLPMFHVGGVWGIVWAILHGGSAVIAERFSTERFWPLVRDHQVTTTGLLGAMVDFLNGRPASDQDRSHGLRSAVVAPYGPAALRFSERFAVDVYTEFNMSELSVPLFAGPNPSVIGTCGTPASGYELRIVDAHDEPVAVGSVGELILRVDQPWTISHGYHNDPEATAATWRNGWFHTGDLFRVDDAGHYHFIDRARDSIRRRGENISSFEVESALMEHPGIAEAVAIGVANPDGAEQEVMAVIRVRPDTPLDPAALLTFLAPRLPHFMLPRFVRFVDALPKTPTQKVEKHRLRDEGLTPDCWDREQAGVTVRAERLEKRG